VVDLLQTTRAGLRHPQRAADDGLVPTTTRSFSQLAGLRSAARRRLTIAIGSIAILSATLLLVAAPAGAVVKEVEVEAGKKVSFGEQPRSTALLEGTSAGAKSFANPKGDPVLPSNQTYAIYWDPTDNFHGDWQELIATFFHNVGAASGSLDNVFAVDSQYTDAANQHALYKSTFMGAYTDTDPYPTKTCVDPHPLTGTNYPWGEPDEITCITNAQIETELKLFIADHHLPTGMGTIFYLLTPPGVTVCLNGGGPTGACSDYEGLPTGTSYENSFCSYHSDINPGNPVDGSSSTILYAAIPWIAGGFGDKHLAQVDQTATEGYRCQDGGWEPSTSQPLEKREKTKEKKIETEAEKKAKEKEEEEHPKNQEEKEEAEKKEEETEKTEILEGPHQQEPNQESCPSLDGYCDTGLPDLMIGQIATEQQNIVTDPLLDSWKEELKGNEATDECRDFFANGPLSGSATANPETYAGTLSNQSLNGGSYYLNNAFNLAALKLPYPGIPCLGGVSLEPRFTAPNPVNYGEVVGFDGMESYLTLNEGTAYTGITPKVTYATYKWNFGDGTPEVTGYAPGAPTQNSPETSPCPTWLTPCAASVYHSYQYGGTYEVTLTITDTGGNTASFSEAITVDGPSAPSQPSGGGSPSSGGSAGAGATTTTGSGTAASSAASATGSSGSGTPAKPIPGPVASAAVVSRSLATVLKKGLVISYSVNEQVAGQFQVLLASSLAKRIGLHGPAATGLAPGSVPSIVIGKAILVTTKGGRNTVKIMFGKKTAAKLRKLGTVPLTIRLIVRNAASHNPQTTTVISAVTLSR
jgi:hypothetical protein